MVLRGAVGFPGSSAGQGSACTAGNPGSWVHWRRDRLSTPVGIVTALHLQCACVSAPEATHLLGHPPSFRSTTAPDLRKSRGGGDPGNLLFYLHSTMYMPGSVLNAL